MDPNLRNEFRNKFQVQAEEFNLGGICMNTFVRQIDPKTQISATDMVYSLSSILESPKNLSKKDFGLFLLSTEEQKRQAETQNMLSSRVTSVGTMNTSKDSDKEYNLEAAQECKYANFWVEIGRAHV